MNKIERDLENLKTIKDLSTKVDLILNLLKELIKNLDNRKIKDKK